MNWLKRNECVICLHYFLIVCSVPRPLYVYPYSKIGIDISKFEIMIETCFNSEYFIFSEEYIQQLTFW